MASKAQRRRARWVKAAHAMGMTFEGYKFWKGGGSRALAERRESSLKRQAAREMDTAYAPVAESFTRREQQIKDLDTKHAADEAAYRDWLAGEQARIRQEQDTRVAATRSLVEGQQADLVNRVKEMGDQRIKEIQAQGGSTAPQAAVVTATAQAAEAAAKRGVESTATKTLAGTDLLAATSANNFAYLAGIRSKRQAATLEALAEVAEGRDKAALQRAADHNRRVAQLLEGEVQKAQLRIASSEFSTKEANDLLDAARGRSVSRDKTAATREGQAGTQKRWEDTVNKYGYTNAQWKRFSPSHRKRIQKQFEKDAKKNKGKGETGPANKRQVAAAKGEIANARQYASGIVRPPQGDRDQPWPWPPPKAKPGQALRLSTWLQRNWQWNKNKADVVAWQIAYRYRGKGAMPNGIQRRFYEYAATLPG